jgi:hypothetical protein
MLIGSDVISSRSQGNDPLNRNQSSYVNTSRRVQVRAYDGLCCRRAAGVNERLIKQMLISAELTARNFEGAQHHR